MAQAHPVIVRRTRRQRLISYAGDSNNNSFSGCADSVGVTITALP
jgi:hypothetical protein